MLTVPAYVTLWILLPLEALPRPTRRLTPAASPAGRLPAPHPLPTVLVGDAFDENGQ